MKKGISIVKKRKRLHLKETTLLEIISRLSGLDATDFGYTLVKTIKKFIPSENLLWIPIMALDDEGEIVTRKKIPAGQIEKTISICRKLSRRRSMDIYSDGVLYLALIDNQGELLGFLVLIRPDSFITEAQWLKSVWVGYKKILSSLCEAAFLLTSAKEKSFIDDVTQLYNQRYLDLVLEKEIRRSARSDSPFSVLFIDVDHFKDVNDSKGHLVGSKLLQQVSDILKQNIRIVDYGFRYGGDEFLLILVGTPTEAATQVGERIRSQIESHEFLVDGEKMHLTLSVGVAAFPQHAKTKEEIIRMADEAMYASKRKNRNVVSVAS